MQTGVRYFAAQENFVTTRKQFYIYVRKIEEFFYSNLGKVEVIFGHMPQHVSHFKTGRQAD